MGFTERVNIYGENIIIGKIRPQKCAIKDETVRYKAS